jgi:glycine C-acetyltransferase
METKFMDDEYNDMVDKKLDWVHKLLTGPSTAECVVDGKRVIMLCSNNYLGLSYHPRLIEAARKSIDSHGVGSGSVRAIAGNMDLHEELEEKFAKFKEQVGVMITQSGYAANAGVIPQLAN